MLQQLLLQRRLSLDDYGIRIKITVAIRTWTSICYSYGSPKFSNNFDLTCQFCRSKILYVCLDARGVSCERHVDFIQTNLFSLWYSTLIYLLINKYTKHKLK